MLREYSNTRVLIDYDAFESALPSGVLICTNQGVLNALRVLIRSYGLRAANWATAYSEAGYIGASDAQFDLIDSEISQFLEETNEMTFCTDITTALETIANNLGTSGCECGSAGAGGSQETPSTNQPGVPGNPQPGDSVPPGFADYAEYNAYKCDIAEWIVQQVQADLTWWQGANFVTITVAAFVAGLLTPIPGDELIAGLGLLTALALQGVTVAAVGNMIDAVANNREAFLCAMYNAGNAAESSANLATEIDAAIDGETTAIYAPLLKTILGDMFNANNVNRLYERWDEKVDSLPTGDCSDCVCVPTTNIGTETGPGEWDTEFWAPATDPPGKNVISVSFFAGGACEVNDLLIVPTNINPNPVIPGQPAGYQLYDKDSVRIYNSINVPPATDGVHGFIIQSSTAGSVDVTWTT